MWLLLHPLDTQFYRDGRPFDAGSRSNLAYSVFPPYPRTVYGALRTAILSLHSPSLNIHAIDPAIQSVIGTPDTLGSLVIRGPLMVTSSEDDDDYELLFPRPRDLLKVKNTKDDYALVSPCPEQDQSTLDRTSDLDIPGIYPCLPETPLVLEESDRVLLEYVHLEEYLIGSIPERLRQSEEVFCHEPRLGIALDYASRTSRPHWLYTSAHVRMSTGSRTRGGLLVDIATGSDGGFLPKSGQIRVGGEGRVMAYTTVKGSNWSHMRSAVKKRVIQNGQFKVYLLTPSIFRYAWYPDFLHKVGSMLQGELPGIPAGVALKVQMVGACVGRSIPIGGFDVSKGRGWPKSMQKAVPPGSIYFLRLLDWESWDEPTRTKNVELLLEGLFFRPLSDCSDKNGLWKEGFGIALIGGW